MEDHEMKARGNTGAASASDAQQCPLVQATELPEISRQVIEAYYHKEYAPLLAWVSDDVVFIGSGPDITFSKAELEAACAMDAEMPAFRMENAAFSLVATNLGPKDPTAGNEAQMRAADAPTTVASAGQTEVKTAHAKPSRTNPPVTPGAQSREQEADFALVQGFYDLFPEGNRQMITVAHQRVSVCLRRAAKGWEAFHIHSSNEWSELVGDEVFPVQTSRQTYEYVMNVFKKIAQRSDSPAEQGDDSTRQGAPNITPRLRISTRAGLRTFDPTNLIWAEAHGKSCIAHFTDRDSEELPCTLATLESKLSGDKNFVRTHRSHLVNADAVRELRAGEIELIDGTVLPVPAKRHASVRHLLLDNNE